MKHRVRVVLQTREGLSIPLWVALGTNSVVACMAPDNHMNAHIGLGPASHVHLSYPADGSRHYSLKRFTDEEEVFITIYEDHLTKKMINRTTGERTIQTEARAEPEQDLFLFFGRPKHPPIAEVLQLDTMIQIVDAAYAFTNSSCPAVAAKLIPEQHVELLPNDLLVDCTDRGNGTLSIGAAIGSETASLHRFSGAQYESFRTCRGKLCVELYAAWWPQEKLESTA